MDTPLIYFLLVLTLEGAERGLSGWLGLWHSWAPSSGSWLWLGQALAVVRIWGCGLPADGKFLSDLGCLSLFSVFEILKYISSNFLFIALSLHFDDNIFKFGTCI